MTGSESLRRTHVTRRAPNADAASQAVADDLIGQALRHGQTVRLRAATGSMMPSMQPGDLVLATGRRPTVGEVALVWTGTAWLAHRVRAIDSARFLLKGDSAEAGEHWESATAVRGTIVRVEYDTRARLARLRRWVSAFLRRGQHP